MSHAVRAHRLIPDVARGGTYGAFFLDVGDFAFAADFSVTSGHAPTGQRGEPQQTNQAHSMTSVSSPYASDVPNLRAVPRIPFDAVLLK